MVDQSFQEKLRQELESSLLGMNELEQRIARLYFQLDGGDAFSIQKIARILKRNPKEVTFLLKKMWDRFAKQELLHALPRRSHKAP